MTTWHQNAPLSMIGDLKEGMKSSEKLKLKRKVPANKSNSRFSKGHFWENKMCQNSITCQSKLSFWVSKIKIGPLLSYFIFKCFISFKICQINYNLLTPISHPFHLTSFLRPDNLKRNLTVCSVFQHTEFEFQGCSWILENQVCINY